MHKTALINYIASITVVVCEFHIVTRSIAWVSAIYRSIAIDRLGHFSALGMLSRASDKTTRDALPFHHDLTDAILQLRCPHSAGNCSEPPTMAIRRRHGGVVGRPRTSSGVASTSRRGAADSWWPDVATCVSRRCLASARLALVFDFPVFGEGEKNSITRVKKPPPQRTRLHVTLLSSGWQDFRRGERAAEMRDSLRCLRGWHWWSVCENFLKGNANSCNPRSRVV